MHTTEPTWKRFVSLFAIVLTMGLVLGSGSPAVAAPASEAPAAVSRATPTATTAHAATPSEIAKYASRDKKASKELRQFAGGDTLVIGATSAVLLILLIVVIVLLVR